jgi:hypothetical protein
MRKLIDLMLHLIVLITLHLVDDLLFFDLELFKFFLMILHHLLLVVLKLLDIFLEALQLVLQLALERSELRRMTTG